jgi:hypothetical protein
MISNRNTDIAVTRFSECTIKDLIRHGQDAFSICRIFRCLRTNLFPLIQRPPNFRLSSVLLRPLFQQLLELSDKFNNYLKYLNNKYINNDK